MCSPKRYGFSAVLVINRVSIFVIFVINKVLLLPSSLDMGMFLKKKLLFCHCLKYHQKCSSRVMFNIGLN